MSHWKLKIWTWSLNMHLACVLQVTKPLLGMFVDWRSRLIRSHWWDYCCSGKQINLALSQRGTVRKSSSCFSSYRLGGKHVFQSWFIACRQVELEIVSRKWEKQLDPSQEEVGERAAWASGRPLPSERSPWPTESADHEHLCVCF